MYVRLILSRLLLFFLVILPSVVFGLSEKKPNILFILTDDQRWDTLGCYGNKDIKTPNLDLLASQGARFDSFYVASPLCCPSRASYLTGQYAHQLGVKGNEAKGLPDGTKTIAHYLNEAGYVTGLIGKTHLGHDPFKWGFKNCPVYEPEGKSRHLNPTLVVGGKFQTVPGMITGIFVDAAIEFVRAHQKDAWFLWLSPTAPHEPYMNDPKYRYDASKLSPSPGWPPGWNFPKPLIARYYASITMLDQELGRLISELKKLGLDDSTFILVASDNGYMFGSHGVKDKMSWHEGSARVPALVRWSGHIKESAVVKSVVSNLDVLPTFLELAGLPVPKNVEAYSMLPALSFSKALRGSVFSRHSGWRMIRKDSWKYVKYEKSGKPQQLYDIANDPLELKNLAENPAYTKIVSELRKEVDEWQERTPTAKSPVFSDVPPPKRNSDVEKEQDE